MTAQDYLKEHGITEDFAKSYGVSWDTEYLHIPIKDEEGHDLFTKSRYLNYKENKDGQPKYKNSAGSHASLFNINNVQDSQNIVLCEGEIDALKLSQHGIPAVSSTNGAGSFLPEWEEFFKDKRVWICFDNDEAGQQGVHKVIEHIPHARIISLPEGSKDICEYYAEYSNNEFVHLMRTALSKIEWEATHIPEEHSLLRLNEITKMEFEEHAWLIENIIYSEGFCFIYGAEGTGKSYITLSMAEAIARGEDWLGEFHVPHKRNVLFLDKENPLSMTSKRAKGLGMDDIDNIFYLKYPEKFQLSDGKGGLSPFAQSLATTVQKEKIACIFIDSFVDFMVGNESSSADTQMFFNVLRELYPRIAFPTLHHENKPSQGVFRNDSQRLRGSSNINAQTFTMFRLEAVANSKTELTLKQTKARDSQKLDKFMIRMVVDDLPEGGTIVSGFEYVGEVGEAADDTKFSEMQQLITDMISDKRMVSNKDLLDIATGKGVSQKTARRAIKDLLETGEIVEFKKGREKWFSAGMFGGSKDEDFNMDEVLEDLSGGLDV